MSHKCGCKKNNCCGSEGICGINPCCLIIGVVVLGFLFCGNRRC
jgi:hypothetical protein